MVFFGIIRIIMRVAPIGAFGAMAFTVGKFGNTALLALSKLVLCTYLTEAFYVVVVLGVIAYFFGFNLFQFVKYIGDEILLVIGTSSSESVLPQLMQKLERFGASRSVVDLVLPTGYAFNLGGLALSLPISTVFIAQVYHVPLTFSRLLALVAVMLVTSKGAAGVTGAAFIVLATTVAASAVLPLEGLALVFAVDNFLSMARALANVIGNGVAAVVVAKLEHEFNSEPAAEATPTAI
jgi:aerobic C4-dicarboxylate transport protein